VAVVVKAVPSPPALAPSLADAQVPALAAAAGCLKPAWWPGVARRRGADAHRCPREFAPARWTGTRGWHARASIASIHGTNEGKEGERRCVGRKDGGRPGL